MRGGSGAVQPQGGVYQGSALPLVLSWLPVRPTFDIA
jgi:hypothetical protein